MVNMASVSDSLNRVDCKCMGYFCSKMQATVKESLVGEEREMPGTISLLSVSLHTAVGLLSMNSCVCPVASGGW